MRIRLEGEERLERFLVRVNDVAVDDLAAALTVEAEAIMTASKREVPVDLGTLRGSGHVAPADVGKTKATVAMGYGGAASAYALIQHERLDFYHDDGKAKYLEDPANAAARGMGQRIGRRLRLHDAAR